MKPNIFTSPQNRFTFSYPGDWESLVVEEIPAFFHPQGTGVLQIYSFENKISDVDPMKELENYIAIHEIDFNEDLVAKFKNSEGNLIYSCEFKKDDRHWCAYSIANGKKMVIATFNSDIDISDLMFRTLATIISSLRFLDETKENQLT
jgi:hypothetical protein